MRIYSQLTRGKRYQIRALLKAGNSQSKVVFYLKVHKSTISREIRLNQGHKGYRPRQAHEKAAFINLVLNVYQIDMMRGMICLKKSRDHTSRARWSTMKGATSRRACFTSRSSTACRNRCWSLSGVSGSSSR